MILSLLICYLDQHYFDYSSSCHHRYSLQHYAPMQPQQYEPPHFLSRYQAESEVPPPVVRDRLVIDDFPRGTISTAWIKMMKQGLSEWLRLPVIVARGIEDG